MAIDKRLHILVVDDHDNMRRTILRILRLMGFTNLVSCGDGQAAWGILNDRPVELIILDWNMPVMTGMELLRQIRSSKERFHNVLVLMVTAEAKQDNVVEAMQAGATNYIVKPFNTETLERKLLDIFREKG